MIWFTHKNHNFNLVADKIKIWTATTNHHRKSFLANVILLQRFCISFSLASLTVLSLVFDNLSLVHMTSHYNKIFIEAVTCCYLSEIFCQVNLLYKVPSPWLISCQKFSLWVSLLRCVSRVLCFWFSGVLVFQLVLFYCVILSAYVQVFLRLYSNIPLLSFIFHWSFQTFLCCRSFSIGQLYHLSVCIQCASTTCAF